MGNFYQVILNVQIKLRKLKVLLCLRHYLGFYLNGKKLQLIPDLLFFSILYGPMKFNSPVLLPST